MYSLGEIPLVHVKPRDSENSVFIRILLTSWFDFVNILTFGIFLLKNIVPAEIRLYMGNRSENELS